MVANEQAEVLVKGHAQGHAEQVEQTSKALQGAIETQMSGPGAVGRLAAGDDGGQKTGHDGPYGQAKDKDLTGKFSSDRQFSDSDRLPKCDIIEDKCWNKPIVSPSPEDVKKAQESVDGQISKLLAPEDQKALKTAQDSILAGDAKGFAGAMANMDPERRRAFVEEINKNLNESQSGMHMVMDHAGNVVTYNDGNRGVEISPQGDITVRAIEHGVDGSIIMKGEVLGADGGKALRGLANEAVNSINNGGDQYGDILKKLFPEKPFYPFERKEEYPIMDSPGQHKLPELYEDGKRGANPLKQK
ncbi:MAG TPA: hypothetical protein V6D22_06570 [Candidatus Obscuribacterales bacterium]